MSRTRWILGLMVAVLALAGCTKERGEATREDLEEAGYEVSQAALFRAAESDDLAALAKLAKAGMAIDTRDATGRTALHAAAGSGALQSVDLLLDRGLAIDVRDDEGRTPLMEAVLRSTPETVRYLLRNGADPALKDAAKYKPLMLAVREGRAEMVPELATFVRDDLDDALLAASIFGQARVIDELTNFGASIYTRLEDGRTPLMLAAQNGHADAVDMLLAIGANRFAMDNQGRMAADLANHEELASRLAAEPQEGDFELVEPAELGAAMAARMLDPAPGGSLAPWDSVGSATEGSAGGVVLNETGSESGGSPRPGRVEELVGVELGLADPDATVAHAGASATVGNSIPSAARERETAPLVMRAYRQTELPLRLETVVDGRAELKVSGARAVEVAEGDEIPGAELRVIRVERRSLSGKEDEGRPVDTSVIEVEDARTGVRRELIAGLPALAHDPVALVEDAATGRLYVTRTGQRFHAAGGDEWLVGDVRPTQVVLENLATGETMTIPLRGPRG